MVFISRSPLNPHCASDTIHPTIVYNQALEPKGNSDQEETTREKEKYVGKRENERGEQSDAQTNAECSQES
jgi:hypothetical protein